MTDICKKVSITNNPTQGTSGVTVEEPVHSEWDWTVSDNSYSLDHGTGRVLSVRCEYGNKVMKRTVADKLMIIFTQLDYI